MWPTSSFGRSVLLGIICLATAAPAAAAALQDPPSTRPSTRPDPQRRARDQERAQPQIRGLLDRLQRAAEAVQLTDEQRPRVRRILRNAEGELRQLSARLAEMTPDARREALQEVIGRTVEEIHAVLTPEQQPVFRQQVEQFREDLREGANRGQGIAGAVGYLEQLTTALDGLDLTPEQDQKVNESLEALRQDIRRMVARTRNAQGGDVDTETLAAAMRQRLQAFRESLEEILTPEQIAQLEQAVQSDRAGGSGPATHPGRNGGDQSQMMGDTRMTPGDGQMGAMTPMSGAGSRERPAGPGESAFLARLSEPEGLAVGQEVPASLAVVTLDGKEVPLRRFVPRTKPLVVLLGSMSNPTFRDRVSDLVWLRRELGQDAELMLVYTREQYPAGEWTVERNQRDGVSLEQHEDIDARVAAARNLRVEAKIVFEMAVDTMDDSVVETLVGEGAHCAAIVIGRDGRIIGRQQWLDPTGLPGMVSRERTSR